MKEIHHIEEFDLFTDKEGTEKQKDLCIERFLKQKFSLADLEAIKAVHQAKNDKKKQSSFQGEMIDSILS